MKAFLKELINPRKLKISLWSLVQFSVTTVLAILPIILTFFDILLDQTDGWDSYQTIAAKSIEHGELILVACSLIAPVFWLVITEPPGKRRFNSRTAHGVPVLIVTIIGYALWLKGYSGGVTNEEVYLTLSKLFFMLSLCTLYASIIAQRTIFSIDPEAVRGSEDAAINSYEAHRRHG